MEFEEYFEYLNKDIEIFFEWFYDNVKKINDCINELYGIKKC